jgi:hypothetical protein
LPNADLYHELAPHSTNKGEIVLANLLELTEQPAGHDPAGRFQLYRVGDAVSSRNVHSAVLDSFRLGTTI